MSTAARRLRRPIGSSARSRTGWRTRHFDPDQGVARDEFRKLVLTQVLRARRTHGEDHVAGVCGAVVDDDLDAFCRFEAELAHHGARFPDGARTVRKALVPVWR